LNDYRRLKGGRVITRNRSGLRKVLKALKENSIMTIVADQGGKRGLIVRFLNQFSPMSTAAIRLAWKSDAKIIPVFYQRIKGPYFKITAMPQLTIEKTGDYHSDIRNNLQKVAALFERYILEHPQEYLWSYQMRKYSPLKTLVILSDRKTGHLRQSQATATIIKDYLERKGKRLEIKIQQVRFRNKLSRYLVTAGCLLASRRSCQGCLWCLRRFLKKDSYEALVALSADYIVSAGSSLAAVNYILSAENLSKSIQILKPSVLGISRFDLVIMPGHDRPPPRKNVLVTKGALNPVDEEYLKSQTKALLQAFGVEHPPAGIQDSGLKNYIGLLIGGNTKIFHLSKDKTLQVITQIKNIAQKLDMSLLVTTSRRTPADIEGLLKREFSTYPRCRLLLIANEKNFPFAIGAILGLSKIIVVSPESISMISEAVNSGKYVVVFDDSSRLGRRHRRFLDYFSKNKYIYLIEPEKLGCLIEDIWKRKPLVRYLDDKTMLRHRIESLI
jgi:mitochondrial fission protein ELM1